MFFFWWVLGVCLDGLMDQIRCGLVVLSGSMWF